MKLAVQIVVAMATFELYRRSTIGMCLTETLDEMVENGTLGADLAIKVLVQFDKSMTEALDTQVKSKVSIKGHLHTYRFCDNVWTFILQDATFKNDDTLENVGHVKIVACDSKLLTQ
uniref:Transcription initiation factor IIA subunit 2 n=2 Tax=Kalanchoe fedtschenkoi TaxID=63787 RepID=A0A7N0UQ99_KALFE